MINKILVFLLFLNFQIASCAPYIIFLNGTSSAGKSSIALELQKQIHPSLHIGIDHFFVMLPPDYFFEGPLAREGFYIEEGLLKAGPAGKKLMHSMHRAMKALHDDGWTLIIDEVLFDTVAFKDYMEVFSDCKVYFISVKPPLEKAEEWEKERGDRMPGMAKILYDVVYRSKIVDMEIDSSLQSPQESARQIIRFIEQNSDPQAFMEN